MKFGEAIDIYMADQRSVGRINSDRTEVAYRQVLVAHRDDVGNRDPRATGRDDCKRTLARWPNPNTQRTRRAVLISFYDWTMEEGIRKDNPARQTRRPRKRPTTVYRLTRDEAAAILHAAETTRERRVIYLGLCAGIRTAELRGLKALHFDRPGFIWISADIGKGKRERWIPVLEELEPIINDIQASVAPAHFILPGQRNTNPPFNTRYADDPTRPMGAATLWRLVVAVAKRAGIVAHVHPHLLRHAYGDYIAKHAGLLNAQAMLGHADPSTTRGYVGTASLDELAISIRGLRYDRQLPPAETSDPARVETVGIEPTSAIA